MSRATGESRSEGDDRQRPEFSHDPNAQRRDVVDAATPALEQWGYGTELSMVRRRLRGLLGASLVVITIQLFLSPGGITGLLITLWFLLALPVAAVAACVLVLLKDPANAPNVWWDNGTLATVGLISVATMAKVGQSGPIGRAVWQLLFGSDPPSTSGRSPASGGTSGTPSSAPRRSSSSNSSSSARRSNGSSSTGWASNPAPRSGRSWCWPPALSGC
ncbi:hypothetical protein BRD08_04565 [Halobacteriales archaeon SW_10_66_29]|nr:MAG: hypothetical protein BRD08_04565 [Halobacteriales archaeon SW_10_66_29]